jgi:hypothetical protein
MLNAKKLKKKKFSNDLKKVAAMTVGTDLRKTCETVRKHRKHIWDRFEGCPSKTQLFSGWSHLVVKTERSVALCTWRDLRPQALGHTAQCDF